MNNEKQVKALNDLLAKCYDAEKGFKEAAEDVKSDNLKQMFREYATQRFNFGHELKGLIRNFGGDPDKGDTIAAKMHRAWMDLKSAVASNEEKNILEEVVRGEENALEHYQEALDELDPGSIAFNTVVNQRNQIRSVITRVKNLLPAYAES
jgi:uncharacterized protein (TIGR02284 family)